MNETHPDKRLFGYARVSTYGQTLDCQLEQLRKAGCTSRNIYREKVTGARANPRELNRMLGKLAAGDVVTVTRIDRLARSTFDLFAIVKRIVVATHVAFVHPDRSTPSSKRHSFPEMDRPSALARTVAPCGGSGRLIRAQYDRPRRHQSGKLK